MACPYFIPREILNDGGWLHPSRLPLGAGWSGLCCASGQSIVPSDDVLHNACNLGYATGCQRLPASRDWDAIRFAVASSSREQVTLSYVCERAHAPIEHGKLIFDLSVLSWQVVPQDARVRTLAEAFIQTYRARGNSGAPLEPAIISSL